jgi:hypothetical protein
MPSSYKAGLEKMVERTPKYYFIADVSKPFRYGDNGVGLDTISRQIIGYAASNGITDADVYVTAYNTRRVDLKNFDLAEGEGGFNMGLAMGMIYNDVKKFPDHYPVILVSSGNIYKAAVFDNRKIIRDFPESEFYYRIDDGGYLTPFSFATNEEIEKTDKPLQNNVLTYEGFYFKDDGLSEISYKYRRGFSDISYGNDFYIDALLLNERIEKAATKAQIIETVKDGLSQRILTKNTAFIVLETKEQEDELRKRNEDFLNGNDTSWSAPANMSEPGLILAILFTAFLLIMLSLSRKFRTHKSRRFW